jgi:hypothetical protein
MIDMPRYSYAVITGFYGQDMLQELNEKASEGYRLVSVIVNQKLDAPIVAYLEKENKATSKKKQTKSQRR